ncbi:uncharacterized protein LOC115695913 isoform X2 [Cannabis sativa]|uniref:uncharacterized protein LOC115695913 isoform X2 n=1 Tax=Cannabis sativa TaxID=3483 RepID=UPI0029C9CD3C|nr:uncharacterized protein LOC115695913 isoform X2 [Cannabis sativa]
MAIMMMEKKMLFGVQKKRVAINNGLHMKKIKKKKNNNNLFKKIVDYLNHDSYLFTPLTHNSSSTFDFKINMFFSGWERKEKDNKRLVKKIGEYLMSDSYMYAPLLAPQKGPQEHIKKVTNDQFSKSSIKLKGCNKFPNEILQDQSPSKAHHDLHEKGIPKNRSLLYKETVATQTMYENNLRSPSISAGKTTHHQKQKEKGKLGSRIRKEIQ